MVQQIQISPQRVREVAGKFVQSSQQSDQMVNTMQSAVNGLTGEWKGMANQSFFQEYQNWQKDMKKYVELLRGIGDQLTRIATEFENVDRQLSTRR
jgi:WXG100 family type VII secretion target